MIAPVRLIQAFVDRETLDLNLRVTFGCLYPLVWLQLQVAVVRDHADYVALAGQLLAEWEPCRRSRIWWEMNITPSLRDVREPSAKEPS